MKPLVLLFLLASIAGAQTRKPFCDRACWASVVIYSGGASAEWGSNIGQYQVNPLLRKPDGTFSPWKGAPLKAAPLALTFIYQRQHPREMFWLRTAIGLGNVLVAWRNLSIARR